MLKENNLAAYGNESEIKKFLLNHMILADFDSA
jgi:hypothetical protein